MHLETAFGQSELDEALQELNLSNKCRISFQNKTTDPLKSQTTVEQLYEEISRCLCEGRGEALLNFPLTVHEQFIKAKNEVDLYCKLIEKVAENIGLRVFFLGSRTKQSIKVLIRKVSNSVDELIELRVAGWFFSLKN